MSTYKELLSQRNELEVAIQKALSVEKGGAIAKAREIIAEYGLTQQDLFSQSQGARTSKTQGVKVAAKYRDPATGATWTGRGKAPLWMGNGEREKFLIEQPAN